MSLVSAALLVLLVMDPLGNVPFFLAALKDVAKERQRRMVIRELFIALGVMIVFLVAERFLLDLLHISESALSIGGGIVLFMISVRMAFPAAGRPLLEKTGGEEPFIVPLAVPYVAGPPRWRP